MAKMNEFFKKIIIAHLERIFPNTKIQIGAPPREMEWYEFMTTLEDNGLEIKIKLKSGS